MTGPLRATLHLMRDADGAEAVIVHLETEGGWRAPKFDTLEQAVAWLTAQVRAWLESTSGPMSGVTMEAAK